MMASSLSSRSHLGRLVRNDPLHRGAARLRQRNCRRRPAPRVTAVSTVKEVLGDDLGDPGHWNHSVEWWGTQAGGWGKSQGSVRFDRNSKYGNGIITVTVHEFLGSPKCPPVNVDVLAAACGDPERAAEAAAPEGGAVREWRVLRFGDKTRQSVNLVWRMRAPRASGEGNTIRVPRAPLLIDPRCLAFEYQKTMAAAVLATLGASGRLETATEKKPVTIYCLGLGGGSLPAFLAYWLRSKGVPYSIRGVELDPDVAIAAKDHMGLVDGYCQVDVASAEAVMAAAPSGSADCVVIDCFKADNEVPVALTDPRGAFMLDLSSVLNKTGSLVVNLQCGSAGKKSSPGLPTPVRRAMNARQCPGYERDTPRGQYLSETAEGYAKAIVGRVGRKGSAYTVRANNQYNVAVVASRAWSLPPGVGAAEAELQRLALDAARGSGDAVLFDVGARAWLGYADLLE
ncbi:unnamed protein product [Pedinophyceae sp. YPF-701]|nr:unnamed protein product [Pedinophyceae sp. YPF-701]